MINFIFFYYNFLILTQSLCAIAYIYLSICGEGAFIIITLTYNTFFMTLLDFMATE